MLRVRHVCCVEISGSTIGEEKNSKTPSLVRCVVGVLLDALPFLRCSEVARYHVIFMGGWTSRHDTPLWCILLGGGSAAGLGN